MTISILVPAYNEERSIARVMERIQDALPRLPRDMKTEVIVVNDGSTDATGYVLQRFSDRCTVLTHEQNRGLSAAMATGLAVATGDIIIVQHSDLEYPPHCWPDFLAPILAGDADMVAGSRLLKKDNPYIKLSYKFGGMFIALFMNMLFRSRFTDVITAARVFRRELIDVIPFSGAGFAFEVEITSKALRHGFRVMEVPTDFEPRSFEEGKKIRWHHIFGILAVIWRSRFFYRVPSTSMRDDRVAVRVREAAHGDL